MRVDSWQRSTTRRHVHVLSSACFRHLTSFSSPPPLPVQRQFSVSCGNGRGDGQVGDVVSWYAHCHPHPMCLCLSPPAKTVVFSTRVLSLGIVWGHNPLTTRCPLRVDADLCQYNMDSTVNTCSNHPTDQSNSCRHERWYGPSDRLCSNDG